MMNSDYYYTITKRNFLYNIMPISNIESVVKNGLLCLNKAKKYNPDSVADPGVQRRREDVSVVRIHDYACLYFDCRNPMLFRLVQQGMESSLCILVVNKEVLNIKGCIVTDMNAARNNARFYKAEDGLSKIDFDLVFCKNWDDSDRLMKYKKSGAKCAEALVPDCVEYDLIAGAIVNDEATKNKLFMAGFDKRISVDANVFFGD